MAYLLGLTNDVMISSAHVDNTEGWVASSMSASLTVKIQFDFVQQKPDGTMGASTEAGWDLQNNKAA